jgi:hypothetical protein
VQGVVNAILAFLDFHFGRTADLDDGHAASQLGQTFLQLFAVVVAGGDFDLRLDLLDAALMSSAEPRPSTIVVLSLSIVTFLAWPSMPG